MSICVREKRPLRADDLLHLEIPEKFTEFIEGELIQITPAGRRHNLVAHRFRKMFDQHCETHPEFDRGGDNEGFLIRRNPDTRISPDACMFRKRAESPSL